MVRATEPQARVSDGGHQRNLPGNEPSWSLSPMGIGDYGNKNQSLDRDRNGISPGALQIKTQDTCDFL